MKTVINRRAGFTLIEIMIVVAIIGMLAAMAIPNFNTARRKAQRSACINNLKNIDGAKSAWALESKAGNGATPQLNNIQPYLGRGSAGTAPTCPADPASTFATCYNMGDLNTTPTCLIFPGAAGDAEAHRLE